MATEKRRIPRLTLQDPLEARMSGRDVALLDLSNGGALVEHEFPLKAGGKTTLEFDYEDAPIQLACIVVRTRLGRSSKTPGAFAYTSGLRFTDPSEPSRLVVRRIVARMSKEDRG